MACFHPTDTSLWKSPIYGFSGKPIKIPCNNCVGCRVDKINQWSIRLNFEALNKPCAFVTFTYDDWHLNYNRGYYVPTVSRDDFHKYIDKLHHQSNKKFTYFACAEYGDKGRPHYHCIFFGLDFVEDYNLFFKSWRKGRVDVRPLLSGGIRYVMKYLEKKQTDKEYNMFHYTDIGLNPPFFSMSPGIGSQVYLAHMFELRNNIPMYFGNRRITIPYYYRRKYMELSPKLLSCMEADLKNTRRELIRKAKQLGFKPKTPYDIRDDKYINDYVAYINKCKEESIINDMRRRGVPVYETHLFNYQSVKISSGDISRYVDMCLAS